MRDCWRGCWTVCGGSGVEPSALDQVAVEQSPVDGRNVKKSALDKDAVEQSAVIERAIQHCWGHHRRPVTGLSKAERCHS